MAAGQMSQLQRRVRGLLNRMSDSNLPGIVADVLQLAEQEGERAIAETITAELLQVGVCLLYCAGLVLQRHTEVAPLDCMSRRPGLAQSSFCMSVLHVSQLVH